VDHLNTEQRRAVELVRGPVCILAGAGSGKTTTITHRIANQVTSGAFAPGQILAVTFTDKAAGEMRERLARLGAGGVVARTFHSAALAQLRHFGRAPGRILASKAVLLRQIGNGLPKPYRFRPAADLATEVEWAKNRRLTPATYADALGAHEPPIPVDLAKRVFREYERRKEAADAVDFEDLLERAIGLLEEDPGALAEVCDRYRAFTVDEYQDVNLLQQTLLERWLDGRDELCAVGDDYQSIYAFTGATPRYLLELPCRYPSAAVVRLEENYRSTPEILELANRLVPRLGGAEKHLHAARPAGPAPELVPCTTNEDEGALIVARIRALASEGIPLEEMVILFRTNGRSADFEEALAAAGIPFQGAALLEREAARQLLRAIRGAGSRAPAAEVRRLALEHGWLEDPPEGLGERELVRQNDLTRLVLLAERFDDGERSLADFVADLEARFSRGAGSGVTLLTYHRAKGLEFEAVFLPRLEERELPIRQAKTPEALAEERRLLYVGLTRAERHLLVTWVAARPPSRFLAELGVETRRAPAATRPEGDPIFDALRTWRRDRAKADGVPAYVVFHDRTLAEIAERRPATQAELAGIPGVGPAKLERYAEDVLAALRPA
jgi:DNA helicase-2/ATP-dependent DNA helicase PcrA